MSIEYTGNTLSGRLIKMALTDNSEGYRPPKLLPGFYYSASLKWQIPNMDGHSEHALAQDKLTREVLPFEIDSRRFSELSVLGYASVFAGVGALASQVDPEIWPPVESPLGQDAILMRAVDHIGQQVLQLGVFDGMGSYGPNSNILTEFIIAELKKLDLQTELTVEDYVHALEAAKSSARDKIALSLQSDDSLHSREVWAGTALAVLSVERASSKGELAVSIFSTGDVAAFLIPAAGEDRTQKDRQLELNKMSPQELRDYVRQGLLTPVQRKINADGSESGNKLLNSVSVVSPRTVGLLRDQLKLSDARETIDEILKQKLAESRLELQKGQSILVATDGFWEILEVLALDSGTTIVGYLGEILDSCSGKTDEYLALQLDDLLRQAYESIIAGLTDPEGNQAQFRPDNVGFVIIRHL